MASTIKIKNSSTAGAVPTSSDLVQGELAINVTDRRIFTENASGTVVELGTPSIDDNGNATAITIDSSENVGIGTSSPSVKLDVSGAVKFTNGTNPYLALYNGSNTAYLQVSSGDLNFVAPSSGNITSTTGGSERMRIDSSGNVGIGTSSPASQLDVAKTGDAILSLTSAGVQRYQLIARSGGRFDFYDQSAGATRWSTDQSGNLLVGTTTDVLTAARATFKASSGAGVVSAVNSNTNLFCINTNNTSWDAVSFRYNTSTEVGRIACTSTATSYVTSSDYRLKENQQPMVGALSIVQQLKPCTYTWKSTGQDGQGFIAHELQAVVPECVVGEKDGVDVDGNPVYQGIDTSFLVATLTAAIQEQQAVITQLQADVAALKGQ